MRCITIINYSIKNHPDHGDQPIFVVDHLSDRAFANGFRVLNPEYKATPDRITSDTEALYELLEELDASERQDGVFFQKHTPFYRSADRRSK